MKILAILSVVAAAVTIGAGQAYAAGTHHAAHVPTLKVVMHDPGCHWFLIHGKDVKTADVRGPIRLLDLDMNTLKVVSRHEIRYVRVGRSLVLQRGNYVVMMVGQAHDDNYLTLAVR